MSSDPYGFNYWSLATTSLITGNLALICSCSHILWTFVAIDYTQYDKFYPSRIFVINGITD